MRIPTAFLPVLAVAGLTAACLGGASAPMDPGSREVPPGTPSGVKLRFLSDYDDLPPLAERGDSAHGWKVHDFKRPLPPRVAVGEVPSIPAPADATVLFDGTQESLEKNFTNRKWKAKDGGVVTRGGDTSTKAAFGDCQLHVEWRTLGANQADMCNSGVIFMDNRYELQIMDSDPARNVIPSDGIAGAVYGWEPPAVNPIRGPMEWNSYDIVFHRPRFDAKGACTAKARVTVLFNGILVQDNTEFPGPTSWHSRHPYKAHADKLPIVFQEHGGGVEYRNMWIRPLE